MTTPALKIDPAPVTNVPVGGSAVVSLYGPMSGGYIRNPATAADQGIHAGEPLYVSITGSATLGESAGTFVLYPGQSFILPGGLTTDVSVNAATSGHKFSAVVIQPNSDYVPPSGDFPPLGPPYIKSILPAYLYEEYADDEDLQAFFAAYNSMAQVYLDWFNTTPLAVYTDPNISGLLLDWVAEGLYGQERPALPNGNTRNVGPFNTLGFNVGQFDEYEIIGPQTLFVTTDDVFKRIITWNFYKGDGLYFDVAWLKRRVMRFLLGINGTAPAIDNTYQVSVTFGVDNAITIRILNGLRTVTGGSLFDGGAFDSFGFNQINTRFQQFAPLAMAPIFKSAMDTGVLNRPFQYTYTVVIN